MELERFLFSFLQGIIEVESFVKSRRKHVVRCFYSRSECFLTILQKFARPVNNNAIGFTFKDGEGLSIGFIQVF